MQKFTKSLFFISLIVSKNMYAQTDTTAKTLNSVVVTGQFKPQTLKNSVYQVKTVTAQRIALSGATNIQQVNRILQSLWLKLPRNHNAVKGFSRCVGLR